MALSLSKGRVRGPTDRPGGRRHNGQYPFQGGENKAENAGVNHIQAASPGLLRVGRDDAGLGEFRQPFFGQAQLAAVHLAVVLAQEGRTAGNAPRRCRKVDGTAGVS